MERSKYHSKALSYLFLTEMWERFGFYIMQGLLILFMTEYFHYSDDKSYTILGMATALLYIAPIIGGTLADKILGFKNGIYIGCVFLMIGYALLAFATTEMLFNLALAVIIVGNGLFKPNISSLLGMQYSINDPKRDSGFTIFYIGINLGAGLAGLTSGYIKNYFGWHWCFILSSLGILTGLMIFRSGLHSIHVQHKKSLSLRSKILFINYCFLAILVLYLLLKLTAVADWLLPLAGICLCVYILVLSAKQPKKYRRHLFVLNSLIISSIVFWMLYWQMFFSANLFIDRLVAKNFFGWQLTTTMFYASESIYIILLGPLFAWLWIYFSRNKIHLSTINKFILGILFAGIGMLILSISTHYPDSDGLVNPIWIFTAYLAITIGELLLSPIGLSAVTQLAPPHLVGTMMGIWFVATGFGGLLAGVIAKLADIPLHVTNLPSMLIIYQHAFMYDAYIAFITVVLLLIFKKMFSLR